MSGIGSTKIESVLPDDIEQKIREVQDSISRLISQRDLIENDIQEKRKEQTKVSDLLNDANTELNRVVTDIHEKQLGLVSREDTLSQKESALNVYANALKEKEEKINKYLNMFERMKDVVIK